jgi:DNA-binding NarL/FixJ family response regulator
MSRAFRTVVVVSGHPQGTEALDALLVDTSDCDIIYVESITDGYSRIKQVTPDLVIVLSGIHDISACQLLSMLKMDDDVSDIPVVTFAVPHEEGELDEDIAEWDRSHAGRALSLSMN